MLMGAIALALLMAGAPLMALAGNTEADDDAVPDGTEDRPDGSAAEGTSDSGDVDGGTATGEEAAPVPTDYEFILTTGGDHRVDGFRPGTDTLTLTSETWDFDLYDLGSGAEGAALRIDRGEAFSILRFPGLDTLPVDDIYLHLREPGVEPTRMALRDALYPDEGEQPLLPTDPEAPDVLPADPSGEPPLAPRDPDAPDQLPDDAGPVDVLAPADPDAPEDRPAAS